MGGHTARARPLVSPSFSPFAPESTPPYLAPACTYLPFSWSAHLTGHHPPSLSPFLPFLFVPPPPPSVSARTLCARSRPPHRRPRSCARRFLSRPLPPREGAHGRNGAAGETPERAPLAGRDALLGRFCSLPSPPFFSSLGGPFFFDVASRSPSTCSPVAPLSPRLHEVSPGRRRLDSSFLPLALLSPPSSSSLTASPRLRRVAVRFASFPPPPSPDISTSPSAPVPPIPSPVSTHS